MTGDNTYMVVLNGVECGTVGDKETADEYLQTVRKRIACQSDNLVFIDTDLEIVGSQHYFGVLDEERLVLNNMTHVLEDSILETLQRSYTVKVKETTVNLATAAEVELLLNSTIDKYDANQEYSVQLALDPTRELNVLIANVNTTRTTSRDEAEEDTEERSLEAGIEKEMSQIISEYEADPEERSFDDYNYGIVGMNFAEDIEVVEAYLPETEITDLESATKLLTEEQETQQIYEIVSGDTLSGISMAVNIPLDDIIAMNDSLENENTTIYIGQELVITVPVPELSVVWEEEGYYEEAYEADIIYVDNDGWYTTEQVTLQEPVSGYRKVVAIKTYSNEEVTSTEIIKEEVVVEAVPKIIERGTIIPPTYIKPISGGRISSYFGYRSISLKGASTYHHGIDWSTPVGTTVVASSAGTVVKAGWASGYGYVIYINHSDGKQTRYGHLSKVYVSVGQTVSQGQKIAASGNTGRSTGPHLHFEILVNGKTKNPLDYLN